MRAIADGSMYRSHFDAVFTIAIRSPLWMLSHSVCNPLCKNIGYDWNTAFYGGSKRPSLAAFTEHCEHLMDDLSLKQAWVQGKVTAASKNQNGWTVQLSNGEQLNGSKTCSGHWDWRTALLAGMGG